jgi:hypothetical protein
MKFGIFLDEPGTRRRYFQELACAGIGILPLIADGCRCDKETWKYIYDAGFKEVSFHRCKDDQFFYWSAPFISMIRYLARTKITGFAIK